MRLSLAESKLELEYLYKTRRHVEVDNMLSGKPPQSMEQHLSYISAVQNKTRWIYVAFLKKNESMVGYSQIYDLKKETVEIGFAIHPDYQGMGHGKSLILNTISKSKEKFSDKKIILYVLKNNHRAIHLYKGLGFVVRELPLTNETTLGMELVA